jgi:ABC-type transport system substrate-binding protein
LIKAPPLRDAARLAANPEYKVVTHPASAQHFQQGVNTLVPPLDNKKVRQALNYALDRKRFAETAMTWRRLESRSPSRTSRVLRSMTP